MRADFAAGRGGGLETSEKALESALKGLDGGHLNDLPLLSSGNASAEEVAYFIHQALEARLEWEELRISGVAVEEEPGCRARFFSAAEEDI